jgi:transcriptional regulator with XRE-family HTH domain
MQIHEKIKRIRLAKGWSREEMAAKLSLSPQAYGNIERGSTDLTLSRIEQIAEVFEIKPTVLLDSDENGVFNQGILNKNNAYLFQSYCYINSCSPEYLQLKVELEKQQLIIEMKSKEVEHKDQQVLDLKRIIQLLEEKQVS